MQRAEQREEVMSWRLLAVALLTLVFLGCSKVTAENYAKLKVGMSYQEVTGILGSPAGCSDVAGLKSCTWGEQSRHIKVQFAADRVMLFSAQNIR
jgi:hypothetical protein